MAGIRNGEFSTRKKVECHPFLSNLCHIIISSSPINGNHVGHIHPYSIFDLQSAIGKSWMIMAGRVTKILSELCAFARHHKELGRPQWHFHSPEIQQFVPIKKTHVSEEHHLSKSWLIRLPMMIVPWNRNYFSWSLQALLAAKLRTERLRTRTNTSPWCRPWLLEADSWSMSVLWVSKSFKGGLEAKIIGGKPATYAHPVLGNPTLDVILSNPNHAGKSLTM